MSSIKLAARLGVLTVLSAMECAAAPVDLTFPAGPFLTVPLVAHTGHISKNIELGDVRTNGGIPIPVRMVFNSDPKYGSPELGAGWTVPLFASHVAKADERNMKVVLPCGKVFWLAGSPGDGTWKDSKGEWTAEATDSEVTITRKDGWLLRFKKGRLEQIKTDDGEEFTLKYDPEKSTLFGGKQELASLAKGETPSVKVGNKVFQMPQGTRLDEEMEPVRSTLKILSSGKEVFSAMFSPERNKLQTTESCVITDSLGRADTASWSRSTGFVEEINDIKLSVEASSNDAYAWPKITMTMPDGVVRTFMKDRVKGLTTEGLPDGSSLQTHYSMSAGPTFGKLQRIDWKIGDTELPFHRNYYDPAGVLIREKRLGGVVRSFVQEGDRELVKFEDGQMDVSYEADEEGRLTLISEGDLTTTFSYPQEEIQEISRNKEPYYTEDYSGGILRRFKSRHIGEMRRMSEAGLEFVQWSWMRPGEKEPWLMRVGKDASGKISFKQAQQAAFEKNPLAVPAGGKNLKNLLPWAQ